MAGKGDKPRSYSKPKFDENYSQINWTKNIRSTFKTSWGAEYTLLVEDTPVEGDDSPTIKDLAKKR